MYSYLPYILLAVACFGWFANYVVRRRTERALAKAQAEIERLNKRYNA